MNTSLGSQNLFRDAASPWAAALDPGARTDTRTPEYVKGFQQRKFVMSYKIWTVPVYQADASTPRRTVQLTARWAPRSSLDAVPIPDNAQPDPQGDHHLVVLDPTQGCVYEFWGAERDGSEWKAQWGNAIPTDGTGVYPDGLAARASGLSAAAGLVTPEDLRRGEIDHALVFAYPFTKAGGPVAPATASDGKSTAPFALPEGARVRLDPTLNLDSLGLAPYQMTIARALQKYGMILGDTSGALTIYAVNPQSQPPGAYNGLLPDGNWVDLSRIPTDRFQVLPFGEQDDPAPQKVVDDGCANYG